MFLEKKINELIDNKNTVNVTLIGAGKFGSMFLSQAPYTKGLNVFTICDLNIDKAKKACREVGWSEDQINNIIFTEDFEKAINNDEVDVVVEATGHPSSGIKHARTCFKYGKHVIMVNVEADVLAGPSLSAEANSAEVVFSMAYGDQPSLTLEIIEWARASGFKVTAAGKGTKYMPEYHYSTPKTVWDHYGLTSDEAEKAGMNSKMFNSFLDGTKSSLEMSAIANASGLNVPNNGLLFPPCGMDDLASLLKEKNKGVFISPYSTEFDNILVVGPIAGKTHQELIFPVVAPDPENNPDVKYLTYPFYAGGNRGRGQVYPTGEKSNINSFGAQQSGQITEIGTNEKGESKITIVNSEGIPVSQTISSGLKLIVKQGDIVKQDQPLNIDPNVGGFGQEETEIVLQKPERIIGYLAFCFSVLLTQILLILKKKQFEKVQAAELNF